MNGGRVGRRLEVRRLGRVEYEDGRSLQVRFRDARLKGTVGDTLLLLEHPPVLTLGRAARREHLVWSEERIAASGLQIHETERGGEVTYHGPGQVVGYPILDLAPDRKDVRRYVRGLEEVMIRALARFGVTAHREARWPGVWAGREADGSLAKVGALGVHLSRWVTMHGFALNVDPDLVPYEAIVPCGIRDAGVTSIARLQGSAPAQSVVEDALVHAFAEVFDAEVQEGPAPEQTVAVHFVRQGRDGPELLLLRRHPERGDFWQPVTGHIEAGEEAAQAAAREAEEETGAPRHLVSLGYRHAFGLGQDTVPQLVEETAFVGLWDDAPLTLSHEHTSAEWLPLNEALNRLPFAGLREGARRAVRAATAEIT